MEASTGLLGRADALEVADTAIADARDGGARVLLVLGEAGIGKTALLAELARRAEAARMLVLSGRAAEHERELPFGLAADALDDHVATVSARRLESLGAIREAELAAVLPSVAQHVEPAGAASPAERFRFHHSLRALLELLARQRPLALLLDDVHWADDASLELILHLLRRPPRAPHLLVVAGRPVEPMPRLLDAIRAARAGEPLMLGPLDAGASRALLAEVADADRRERLAEEAKGNPLFLTELARVAADPDAPLPATLLAAVGQEVGALPPATRALLEGAAVAGDPFDPELAGRAADLEEDAIVGLDRLVAADLIRPEGAARRFRFRHPLVRRATYDAAPPAWRLAAHERVARALAERDAPAAARAFHLEQCARPGDDEAIAVLVRAAGAAADSSPATAAHWYRAALALLPAGDPRRAELLAPLGIALGAAGRLDEARAALSAAVAALDAANPLRPLLVAGRALLDNLLGRHADAQRALAEELATTTGDAARLPLEAALAVAATFPQDAAAIRLHAGRALDLAAGEDGPIGARALAHGIAAIGALWEADQAATAEHYAAGLAAYDAAPDEAVLGWANGIWTLGYAAALLERPGDSLRVVGRGLEVVRRAHAGHMLAPLATLFAMMATNSLRLDEAEEHADLAEETARLGGMTYQLQWNLWTRAGLATLRGDIVEARRLDAESRPVIEALPDDDLVKIMGLCNLAAQRVDEDPERCIDEMVAAGGPLLERLEVTWSSWLRLVLVRACLALGRRDAAQHWADVTAEVAERHGLPVSAARGVTARAELALYDGDSATAAALARDAAAAFAAHGFRIDELPTRILVGRALAVAGDEDEARAVLRAVADEALELGAWRFRDAAAAELRKLGVRLRTGAGPRGERDELTERERAIAELVAEGQSNKQVAAALYVSEKTVEHHLSRAYAKLGVKTRRELAAAWHR